MENLKSLFGKRLKKIRQERGITQEKLSETLDLSVVQVSRFECGHHFPSPCSLAKMANTFDIELKYLFDFKDTSKLSKTSNKKKLIKLIRGVNSDKTIVLLNSICLKIIKATET